MTKSCRFGEWINSINFIMIYFSIYTDRRLRIFDPHRREFTERDGLETLLELESVLIVNIKNATKGLYRNTIRYQSRFLCEKLQIPITEVTISYHVRNMEGISIQQRWTFASGNRTEHTGFSGQIFADPNIGVGWCWISTNRRFFLKWSIFLYRSLHNL